MKATSPSPRSLSPGDLAQSTRQFIRTRVVQLEDAFDGDIEAAGGDALRAELQRQARSVGIFAPHGPTEFGGHGLGMVERSTVFEEAGHSLFGPLSLNINAPDEGNVHLLDQLATSDQRVRFLKPLAEGTVRSAFAMTEPSPGAGSDPTALFTRATKVDGGWLVDGQKHFITGADGAGVFIIMARTSGEPGDRRGATMLLAPGGAAGLRVTRHIRTVDRSMIGGHCEVRFDDLFVPDSDVLGAVGEGFRHAQVRLGPARMSHVMRWTGAALRAHEAAVVYAAGRSAFSQRIADLGLAQQMIADNEIDLAATRALMREACAELDAGLKAQKATSICKTFAAEALNRVVDRAVQLCGGAGVSADLPVARMWRELRPFRIYDGPSEVHRWSLARRAVQEIAGGQVELA